jgi:hypothetical protein
MRGRAEMTPAEFYQMLKETAEQQGFKPGWIYHKFKDEYGRSPTREDMGLPKPDPLNYYLELEAEALAKGFKPGWAYFRFKEEFGRGPTPEEKGEDDDHIRRHRIEVDEDYYDPGDYDGEDIPF